MVRCERDGARCSNGPGCERRDTRVCLISCLIAVCVALGTFVPGTPAFAEFTHKLEAQITGPSSSESFGQPWSLTFDSGGNLFVADPPNSVVDVFGADGGFSAHVGGGVLSGGYTRGVGVDGSGRVYVADSNLSEVFAFSPKGPNPSAGYELLSQWKEPPFGSGCCFLYSAVDNHSAGPSDERAGDVYVLSSGGVVYVVQPEGASEGKVIAELLAPGAGANGGIAVDRSNGNVYVAEPENHIVVVFNSKGEEQPLLAITGSETPGGATEFRPIAIAIDSSTGEEAIYVVDEAARVVDEFSSAGSWLGQIKQTTPGQALQEPLGVAVQEAGGASKGEVYVSDGAAKVVDVFAAAGVILADVATQAASNVTPTTATLNGNVDPSGIQVSECRFEYRAEEEGNFAHSAPCSPSPGSGSSAEPVSGELNGLAPNTSYRYRLAATNANGTNFGAEESFVTAGAPRIRGELAEVRSSERAGQTTATLQAQVDPGDRETTYRFEYGETTSYGTSIPIPDGELGAAHEFVPVAPAELTGLKVGTAYHFRVVAVNEYGTSFGEDRQFRTTDAALVEAFATHVTATSAILGARVDPLGSPTTYYFQYGTEECAVAVHPCVQVPAAPGAPAGSGEGFVAVVPQQVLDLAAGSTYHYRVVAVNELGVVDGQDQTFTTWGGPGAVSLPDDRAWESVSPANKLGGFIRPLIEEDAVAASQDGSKFAFLSEQSLLPEAQGASVFDQVLARRTSAGWSAEDIATPHDRPPGQGVGQGQEYRLFSPDLSYALVQPFGPFTALSPEATERTPYIRDNASSTYRPLLTAANVPLGTEFGGSQARSFGPVDVVGATPDLRHVLMRTEELALTPVSVTDGLYEWSGGRLQLVDLLPEGEGGGPVEGLLGHHNEDVQHAVSDDGSRVFWEGIGGEHHLYLRDTAKEQTLKLDAVQSGSGVGLVEPLFQIASADGSKVFFTDEQHLTPVSGTSGRDLYECDVTESSGANGCRLSDLTRALNSGESAELSGMAVLGASEDGSYVYFLAHGVLATNENAASGEKATPGAQNLYVLHFDGSVWTSSFIASLSDEDVQNQNRIRTARVSPDGRYLAFMSNRSLTGYDSRDANSGERDEEVFLYAAEGRPRLVCASCNPTGTRPVGVLESGAPRLPVQNIVDSPGSWTHSWLAANVPTQEDFGLGQARYQPRYLSDSGRLFFNSIDALAPEDVNGQWDVYQYEPPGVGSCTSGSPGFDSKADGCVNLISSGRSSQETAFLGASESGGDVFFLTTGRLTSQDEDEQFDVYDAHECSLSPCIAPPTPATPVTCTSGETCRPSPSAGQPVFGPLASQAPAGEGNLLRATAIPAQPKAHTRARLLAAALKVCRAKPRSKRAKCRAAAYKRYGPHVKKRRHTTKHPKGKGR